MWYPLGWTFFVLFMASSGQALYWDPRWDEFKREYGRSYATLDEEIARYKNWKQSIDLVESHNKCDDTFKLKINEYADMSFAEFVRKQTGLKRYKRNSKYKTPSIMAYKETGCTPKTFGTFVLFKSQVLLKALNQFNRHLFLDEWRAKGCVGPVKNQEKCGACWAFTAIASLESAVCIKNGILMTLSEQQLSTVIFKSIT